MGDDEDNPPSKVNLSVQEVESTMDDKTLGKVELEGSGLEDVSNLDDLRFVDAQPEVLVVIKEEGMGRVAPGEGNAMAKDGDVADGKVKSVIRADDLSVDDDVLKDDDEETVGEEIALSENLEVGDVEKGEPVADDLLVGGVELADVVKDDDEEKVALEEENDGVEGGDTGFGEQKGFPSKDDSPAGGNEFVAVKQVEETEMMADEGNHAVEGGEVGDGVEKSVPGTDGVQLVVVTKENDDDSTAGGNACVAVMQVEEVEMMSDEGNHAVEGGEVGDGVEKSVPGADGAQIAAVTKESDDESPACGNEFVAVMQVEEAEMMADEGNHVVEGGEDGDGVKKSVLGADGAQVAAVTKENDDDSPAGGNEFVAIMQVEEGEMMADEGNHAVEGVEVGDGVEKSVSSADGAQLAVVTKENDDDTPVGGMELGAIVKEENVTMSKDENLMPGTEMQMEGDQEREAVVSGGAEASPESHVAEHADFGLSDVMDGGKVGEAVAEIGVEAGVSAGEDEIAKVADDIVKATAEYDIPKEETQTEPEPSANISIVAIDSKAFKDDEMEPEESGGSDDFVTNVDDASEPEAEVYMELETKTKGSEDGSVPDVNDSKQLGGLFPQVTNEDTPLAEEETQTMDTEMETETEMESGKDIRGKRKRGKNLKVLSTRAPSRKLVGEDVCFICFDGGDLVLCDRRGCPKAYHPSCVNRDEAFFRAKGKWNCGWHLCSICEKSAYYMCYTCTFSLCKGCTKDAVILRVRENKGFCETCMKTVMLIENNEPGYAEAQIDFDDRNNWEYLFKDYYMELKTKLSLSSVELAQARNPWKGSDAMANKQESPDELFDANDDGGSRSDNSSENKEISKPKRRKMKKRARSLTKRENFTVAALSVVSAGTSAPGSAEWASKELLEFVRHMRNGDKSVLSQFDVQALLLEYIKQNRLRDPRRKSQIICDSRLESLFGKARVGHFEMLKLLESHFLVKEDSQTDDTQGTVVDTEVNQTYADVDMDALNKGFKEKKRKSRKKGDGRGPQSNLDDYAAIDMHNINLIYLPRKLMEDLLEDHEKFHDKVVGTFVRIRISGSSLKQDIYRLVQVVGTNKAAETYKVGKRTTNVMLEILNLSKTEVISIDTISNQEFTEDECKRLRQSIKCGLINRLTVGDVLDKALEVHAARVNDWLEKETVRLSHLCDRASDMGRRKELRECVEKLQLLKTPEERRRRLEEAPEIHADPKMDPSYESEEDESDMDGNNQEIYMRARGYDYIRRAREPISTGKGDFSSKDSWSGSRNYSNKNLELTRSLSNKSLSNKDEEIPPMGEGLSETSWNHGENDIRRSSNLEKLRSATVPERVGWNSYSTVKSESILFASETSPSLSPGVAETAAKMNETEKVWHYKDPSGKVQGPFSMLQLRKWNKTGYFPVGLLIRRTTEMEDDSVLLTDALAGNLKKDLPSGDSRLLKGTTLCNPHFSSTHVGMPLVEVPKLSADGRSSDYGGRIDSSNLPSPTPKQSAAGWSGGEGGQIVGNSSFPIGGGAVQSPSLASLSSGQFSRSTSSLDAGGGKEPNALPPGPVVSSVGQLTTGSGNGPSIGQSGFAAANNIEQFACKGPTHFVQKSHPADGARMLQSHSHLISSSDTPSQTVQPVSNQNPPVETHWGHNVESNSPMSLPGQAQVLSYSQWTGVPSAAHKFSENFSNSNVPALLQVSPWGPQIPGNQSNMQPSAQANVQWGMGLKDNNSSAPNSRPENISWGPMQGNPNVVWAPGIFNMNWAAVAQGQGPSPLNPNPAWVVPTGNQGVTVQGPIPGNVDAVWVAPTGNPGGVSQGLQPGAGNSGLAAQTGNMGAAVQQMVPGNANPSWIQSNGNPGANIQGPAPGNVNPGWGGAPANKSAWGSGQHQNGDRLPNQGDRGSHRGDSGFNSGMPWNRQSSFGNKGPYVSKGQRACPYFQMGHCKKGSRCDYMHSSGNS